MGIRRRVAQPIGGVRRASRKQVKWHVFPAPESWQAISKVFQSIGRRDVNASDRRTSTDYLVGFYNHIRLHSSLGYLPLSAHERKQDGKQPVRGPKTLGHWHGSRAPRRRSCSAAFICPR
ncbi:MAG TPA: hypothetical protein PKN13_14180 [Accumulibacter sp.]|nr:hypothetical protein [Accumulibacter sp.]HNM76461.1 hypothetical protein [Accumulibacter sp.]